MKSVRNSPRPFYNVLQHPCFLPATQSADIDTGVSSTQSREEAGIDGNYPEFLKNLGPHGHDWLASLFTFFVFNESHPKQGIRPIIRPIRG